MGVGDTLVRLGRFLDDCEENGPVSDVELAEADEEGDEPLVANFAVPAPSCTTPDERGFDLADATVTPDGRLSVSFESTGPLFPVDDQDVAVAVTDVSTDGAAAKIELQATVVHEESTETRSLRERLRDRDASDTDAGVAVTVGGSADDAAEQESTQSVSRSDRDVPPFRDTELLREVYETCDTFAEMPDALGMDVTAETVRRYMIRQGIHEPTSYNTSSDETESTDSAAGDGEQTDAETSTDTPADGAAADVNSPKEGAETPTEPVTTTGEDADAVDLESPELLADGIGLPNDVTIDTIVEAVRTSNTIYEVKQGIGIERDDALEMLKELNLLEFVAGRLATEAEREVSRDQIISRIREQADSV